MKSKILLIIFSVSICFAYGQAGSNDTTFNVIDDGIKGYGPNGPINKTALQPDGKRIIVGDFTSFNGNSFNRIVRINANGSLDNSFIIGTGANNLIYDVAVQADGKIIIVGYFTSFNGVSVNRVARLNVDGSLDASFNIGGGFNQFVKRIKIQSDGKIICAGNFTSFNSIAKNYIARLHPDGTLDNSFNPTSILQGGIQDIALQNDGKLLVAGLFSLGNNVNNSRYLNRLLIDGSLDTSFINSQSGPNDIVKTIATQTDGKIVIGGKFIAVNNIAKPKIAKLDTNGVLDNTFNVTMESDREVNLVYSNQDGKLLLVLQDLDIINNENAFIVSRINASGSVDATFSSIGTTYGNDIYTIDTNSDESIFLGGRFTIINKIIKHYMVQLQPNGLLDNTFPIGAGANSSVKAILPQPDGKLLLAGYFTEYNGTSSNGIVRINPDGSLDTSFNIGLGANNIINSIALQPDGKIIIGGRFTAFNSIKQNFIARLNPDGSVDSNFNTGTGTNDYIYSIKIQEDGKILIAGAFTKINQALRNKIARLNSDGSLDTSFIGKIDGKDAEVYAVTQQADNKIIIGGDFNQIGGEIRNGVARLNLDGSLDETFNTNANYQYVSNINIQNDHKIIIGGSFSSYNGVSNYLVRLNENGTVDNTFNTGLGFNYLTHATAIQADGKIIVVGDFTKFDNNPRRYITRLHTNGAIDTDFNVGIGSNGTIRTVQVLADNKIMIGGDFTNYNGVAKHRIARIFANSTPLSTENPKMTTLKYYPNPIENTFHIESQHQINMITITNLLGQKLLTLEGNNNSIEVQVAQLPSGVYVVSVVSDGKTKSFKVIKK
jgi:uncharacterized delta-60 repeat protein